MKTLVHKGKQTWWQIMSVFMLRGLLKGWKQPIGYFLFTGPIDSDRLRSLLMQGLDEVLKKRHEGQSGHR